MKRSTLVNRFFVLAAAVLMVSACGSSVKQTATGRTASRIQVESQPAADGAASLTALIVDRNTGAQLSAAHLQLIEGSKSSLCQKTGRVIVENVPAGLYKIRCSYPGYEAATRVVEIKPEKTTALKIELVASN